MYYKYQKKHVTLQSQKNKERIMAMDDENRKKRGGFRKGAGRPRKDSRLFTFRASDAMAEYIENRQNKTEFIKDCIQRAIWEDLKSNWRC